MQTVVITGGTGLVGKALSQMLVKKGYQVIILSRKSESNKGNISFAQWDIKKKIIDTEAIKKADYIIHLAGAGVVDKRWTSAYKKEIVDSRVKSSELIIETLKKQSNKVKAIISASAIGWYGHDKAGGKPFTENDKPDAGFLGETCRLWEQSIESTELPQIRTCKIRTGIVLSNDGGALAEFKKPIKMGVAAILGNGKQIISWIHIEDLCRIFIHAIENENMKGSFNAVAPNPVSNKTLTLSLAKMMKGFFFIPVHVPSFILKIIMGESSIEVLKSTFVSSEKIRASGFTFYYPGIDVALKQLLNK